MFVWQHNIEKAVSAMMIDCTQYKGLIQCAKDRFVELQNTSYPMNIK